MIKWLATPWKMLPGWIQNALIFQLNAKYVVGANVIVVNKQGQVWLQNHRFWPKYPWGLPGGHANSHETPQQAIVREIHEELGVILHIDSLVDIQQNKKRGLVVYFTGNFSQTPQAFDQIEIIEAKFFDIDKLPVTLHPSHRKIIHEIVKQKD